MIRFFRWLVTRAIALYLATVVAIAGFAALWPFPYSDRVEKVDIIVVLGAGMDPDGTLHRSSRLRVERGVLLYQAGVAPRMHFSGGEARPGGPSAGEQMARLAISMGVAAAATSWEGKSQSTLQNALLSQPMLEGARSIRLVTEGFHLPRAWLAFVWAGDQQVRLALSERFRSESPNSAVPQVTMVLREAAAFWVNLARLGAHEAARALGVAEATRDRWLE